jgi:hypothetical protein
MDNQSQSTSHNANWELLGVLELSLNADQNETIHVWLNQILEPLHLHGDIVSKVESSLQEAARRALDAYTGNERKHIHLRIHVPLERTSKGTTWGFFRVEKIDEESGDGQIPAHSSELFLYIEAH